MKISSRQILLAAGIILVLVLGSYLASKWILPPVSNVFDAFYRKSICSHMDGVGPGGVDQALTKERFYQTYRYDLFPPNTAISSPWKTGTVSVIQKKRLRIIKFIYANEDLWYKYTYDINDRRLTYDTNDRDSEYVDSHPFLFESVIPHWLEHYGAEYGYSEEDLGNWEGVQP